MFILDFASHGSGADQKDVGPVPPPGTKLINLSVLDNLILLLKMTFISPLAYRLCNYFPTLFKFGQRIYSYFVRGSITVRLTSCLTGLDSTNQVNMLII